ncbi:phospholipase D family protein [Roseomonas sp. BN140053]|uniref:phospholipase D family protein n=1 Tax=Roseomonas sp. BN140053 TaxID=3391898 RepID=UPI0039EC5830
MSSTALRRAPDSVGPGGAVPLDDTLDRLLGEIRARTGAALVVDGLEAFALRAVSARSATRTLDLQYYAWHDGVTGRLLAREVLCAADRGVKVRLLLDDTAVLGDDAAFEALVTLCVHPSIETRLFNAHRWRFLGRFGFALEMLLSRGQLNHRMHNKSWIADGRLAILGGRNIGNEYFDAAGDFNFRDLDIVVAGEAASQAVTQFERYWNHRLSRRVSAYAGTVPSAAALEHLRHSLAASVEDPDAAPYLECLQAARDAGDILHGDRALLPADRVRVAADPPDKATGAEVEGKLVRAVDAALSETRYEALLISPYFVPGEAGAQVLIDLVKRGVKVSVVTNSLAATDVVAVHGGYSRYRRRLLKAGVEIFELKRSGQEESGVLGSRGASLHTKAFALDGTQIFVGSFNLDPRSADLNTEMGAFLRHPGLTRALREEFARLASPERSYRVALKHGLMTWTDRGAKGRRRVQRKEPDADWRRRLITQLVRWLPIESQL